MSRGAAKRPHRRILLIVVALILYGSLYPWEFRPRQLGANPLWVLLHSWPRGFNRYIVWDVAVNVALYVPLGVFGFLAMRERAPRGLRVLAPLALAAVLSASVEMLQLFDRSRECSLSDVASNVAGAAVGVAVAALYRAKLQGLLGRQEAAALTRPSAPLLLLSCWLGYLLFPLFPSWGRTNLFRRIAALGPVTAISPIETLLVFSEWLAVACLLDSILRPQTKRLLPLLMLLVPARLLISERSLAWADMVGATAAYAAWFCLPRAYVWRGVPMLLAGMVLLGEMRPFHFVAAHTFDWVPFRPLFRSSWQRGFVVLFRKSFWYGLVIWLWRQRGHGWAATTAVSSALLLAMEWVQRYLPRRTPETTDGVLALLMGVLLWLLSGERAGPYSEI